MGVATPELVQQELQAEAFRFIFGLSHGVVVSVMELHLCTPTRSVSSQLPKFVFADVRNSMEHLITPAGLVVPCSSPHLSRPAPKTLLSMS